MALVKKLLPKEDQLAAQKQEAAKKALTSEDSDRIATEAQALMRSQAANQTTPAAPVAAPVAPAGAPSVLTPEMESALGAAKKALAGGDTAGAAKSVQEASGLVSLPGQSLSSTQAVENVSAVQGARPAVNTASPTGLWTGAVSPDNIEGAPTSVIAQTATPEQARNAAQIALAAPGVAKQVLGGPGGAPGGSPAEGGTVDNQTQEDPAPTPRPPAGGASGTVTPAGTQAPGGPQTLLDLMNNPGDFGQYRDVASMALSAKYDPQVLAAQQALAQSRLGLSRDVNSAQRQVLAGANRRGTALWGTTLNAQAQVAGRAMEGLQLQENQTNQRIEGMRSAQGNELLPFIQNLFTNDRNFQEDVRRYGQDYAIRKAAADFALKRGESLLPYEIQGAGLGNQQAAFNLQSGQSLLPHQIAAAILGNTGKDLANEQSAWNLQNAQTMQPIQQRAAELANEAADMRNQVADLEWTVANDPNVGTRAQAAMELEKARKSLALIDSQIAENQAQTTKASQPAEQKATAQSVAQRWELSPADFGSTTNYGAFEKYLGEIADGARANTGATYQDAYDYIVSKKHAEMVREGVSPSALLAVVKRKFFPSTTE